MIPLKDDNPRSRFPIITIAFIAINIVAFYFEFKLGFNEVIDNFGAIPENIKNYQRLETLFTSMFLHGGFWHIGGNMLYLWIFGDNIESYLGHSKFIAFYLLCGLLAAAAHIFFSVTFAGAVDIPMVGASGAVAGILGAYLVKYPKARVLVVIPIFLFLMIRRVPALFVLGLWFVMQLLYAFYGLSSAGQGGGVAFWAHIGGFVAGVVLINLFGAGKRRVTSHN